MPRSPVIGEDSPVQYDPDFPVGGPRTRMPQRKELNSVQTPAPFEYERATSVDGALASLERLGADARVIAGGHSLLPMMKLRLASPST